MNYTWNKLASGLLMTTMALSLLSGGALAIPIHVNGNPGGAIVSNTPPESMIYILRSGDKMDASVWYQPSVNGNLASVTVQSSLVTAALKDAEDMGITADTKLTLMIEVAPDENATRLKLTVPASALKAMADQPVTQVDITSGCGEIMFDAATASVIAKQAGSSNVGFHIGQADEKDLSSSQKETVGGNTAYSVSIKAGSSAAPAFDGAAFTVILPYTQKEGELADGIVLNYIDDQGAVQTVPSVYDATSSVVKFDTTLLGTYFISYTPPVVWENPFTDVQKSDWYFDAVRNASLKGLFGGTSDTTFSPNTSMTRAMLVTVLWRYAGAPDAQVGDFTDIAADAWYAKAVNWAAGQGVVSGVGSYRFDPDGIVTREQAASILYRYAQKSGIEVPPAKDSVAQPDMTGVSAWAVDGVHWAVRCGMLIDRGTDGLVPSEPATRAELAAMLVQMG